MATRKLKDEVEERYFSKEAAPAVEDEGMREMHPLQPFIISGGKNTERYYFQYVSEVTQYKFNVEPKYFGNESQYTEVFPQRIERIIKKNSGAKVFCVFDWDTVYGNSQRETNHKRFMNQIKEYLKDGSVVLCPSMPSIEYWFLLHFEDCDVFLKKWGDISQKLAPYIRSCFPAEEIKGMVLKKILKGKEYLDDRRWVEKLCKDGKLELAISRAESGCQAHLREPESELSYTFVYLIFKEYPLPE